MTNPPEPMDRTTRTPGTPPAEASRSAAPGPFTFPAVARLELDELLDQLIGRATEVLRTQGRLRGLLRATQVIATDLDLPHLLQRIVDEARGLIGARYAAIGVIGADQVLTQFVHTGMGPDRAGPARQRDPGHLLRRARSERLCGPGGRGGRCVHHGAGRSAR